ncbi:hypothetical protein JH25_27875 [Pseudomonas sp. BRG-100]|nr:hypothetical protein JH25_27875 [Pseudomonas sp. BRG-100]
MVFGYRLFAIRLIATNPYRCSDDCAQEYSVVSALMDIKNNQQQLLELQRSHLSVKTEILKVQRLQYQIMVETQ